MRKRSMTIYAESQEEFINIMKEQDSQREKNTKRKSSKLSEIIEENLNLSGEGEACFEFLSLNDEFQIVEKEQTWQEIEREEEDKLISKIENMNKCFKNKDKKEFLTAVTDLYIKENLGASPLEMFKLGDKSKRSHSFDTMENLDFVDYEMKLIPSKKQALENNFSNNSFLNLEKKSESENSFKTGNSSLSTNFSENIIMQNLILSDEIVKLIVIGDKQVGKSFFIDKVVSYGNGSSGVNNTNNTNNNDNREYRPTLSLEIKKLIFNAVNKIIKIELWDTNVNILTSHLINTYFKLCNGFVLICDISNLESIKFVEKQIESVINLSTAESSIILIANIKEGVNTEECHHNLEYLNYLEEKFFIKANFLNLNEYSVEKDFKFQKFLNNCLIKKSGSAKKNKPLQALNRSNNSEMINKNRERDVNITVRDLSASPKNKKNENCLLF